MNAPVKDNLTKYVVFCLVVIALGVGLIESCKPRPPRRVVWDEKVEYSELLDVLNEYRDARRLPPFQYDAILTDEATTTAKENAQNRRLKHLLLNGAGRCEIIAENWQGFRQAVDQWDKSKKGHHEAINSRAYKKAGCAMIENGGRFYCCVRFR